MFNADAIKKVELVKGGYPARYGGRLSSVLDIRLKDGNMKKYKASGNIGIISSKVTFEGQLLKIKHLLLLQEEELMLMLCIDQSWLTISVK